MSHMNQALANLSPEQRQLVELMLRQREDPAPISPNTIIPQRTVAAPLSFAQQRLWFLDQLEPSSAAYNLPLAMRVDGKLDVKALTQSLNEVVARHDVLRTTFAADDEGQPAQIVAPTLTITLPLIDLPAMSPAEQAERVRQLVLEEAGQPFHLEHGPLMRASLLRLSANEHILLLTMHHSVSDGWSISLLMREMAVLYHAFSVGKPSPLPDLPIQYADYAIWQRKWLTGEVLEQQLGYWKHQLRGDLPALDLPTDHRRPAIQTLQGAITKFQIPRDLTDRLKALGQQHAATLFMVLLGAFQTLLHRYTGQHDLIVGTPIANRNRVETESLIGFFLNTLALRVDLSCNPTFVELLQRVRKVTLGAYAHQDLPFERLIDELQLKRDMSRTPLFQAVLALQNMPIPTIEAAGLKLTSMDLANSGTAKFDLTLTLTETPDGLRGMLEYRTDLFEAATMERLLGHYQILLAGIVANPQQHLSELPLLPETERHQLLVEWNQAETDYPQEKCIHELFESQVEKTPEAVAVVFGPNTPSTSSPVPAVHRPASGAGLAQAGQAPGTGDQHLTYAQLNTKANQLAHYLRKLGVGPDVLVGICVERSLEMIVGLMGILKAGGAYVPLDPAFPPERLAYMFSDSALPVLLTQQRLADTLPEHRAHIVLLDADWGEIATESDSNLRLVLDPERLSYVIYTSGSTGRPKGVQVTQRALVNFLSTMRKKPGITPADRLLSVTTLSFDIAGLELYLPLIAGARVEIIPRELAADGFQLRERLRESETTILQATPATWRLLLEAGWDENEKLKVLCGGEALPPDLADKLLLRSTSLWNLYGPTETTIWSTLSQLEMAGGIVPIGKPIANTQVYVLDQALQPVPVGVSGELYIGGAGVARGYLNRPDLTAERFIPNPFATSAVTVDGGPKTVENHRPPSTVHGRLYKTGDLARYLPDGNIEYLGRIDYQVKVRGFRIELGEIEAALMEHVDIQATVVMVREDTPSTQRLVAYVVSQQKLDPAELRSFMKARLPDYMLPSAFVFLENLPLTPNGKINRKALPAPDMVRSETGYVAPRTNIEAALAHIWATVLKLDKVSIHDNFFELGGDSLLSLRIVALANKEALHLTPKQIFQYQTLAELAAVVNTETEFQAEQGLVTGPVPLTCDQYWYLYHAAPYRIQPERWNTSLFLQVPLGLSGEKAVALLEHAVQAIWRQHDALRARFVYQESIWRQYLMAPEEINPFSCIDLCAVTDAEMPVAIETQVEQLQNSLNLANGPLFRVAVFDLGPHRIGRLLIIAHHLVMDGFSLSILLKDLQDCYQQLAQSQPIQLPPKTVSLRQWAELLHQYAQSDSVYQELDYWLNLPWADVLPLPIDDPAGCQHESMAAQQSLTISFTPEETGLLLREISTFYQTSPLQMLLMALTQTITHWTGGQAIEISCPVMGRDILPQAANMDLSRTVGWFALSNVLVLCRTESEDMLGALRAIQIQLQQTPNQSCSYHFLADLRGDEIISRQLKPLRKNQLIFNYLGQMQLATPETTWLSPAPEHAGDIQDARQKPFDGLYIMGGVFENKLSLTWNYSDSVYRSDTIARQAQFFQETLQALITRYQDHLEKKGN